jgi:hypothetical protein
MTMEIINDALVIARECAPQWIACLIGIASALTILLIACAIFVSIWALWERLKKSKETKDVGETLEP